MVIKIKNEIFKEIGLKKMEILEKEYNPNKKTIEKIKKQDQASIENLLIETTITILETKIQDDLKGKLENKLLNFILKNLNVNMVIFESIKEEKKEIIKNIILELIEKHEKNQLYTLTRILGNEIYEKKDRLKLLTSRAEKNSYVILDDEDLKKINKNLKDTLKEVVLIYFENKDFEIDFFKERKKFFLENNEYFDSRKTVDYFNLEFITKSKPSNKEEISYYYKKIQEIYSKNNSNYNKLKENYITGNKYFSLNKNLMKKSFMFLTEEDQEIYLNNIIEKLNLDLERELRSSKTKVKKAEEIKKFENNLKSIQETLILISEIEKKSK